MTAMSCRRFAAVRLCTGRGAQKREGSRSEERSAKAQERSAAALAQERKQERLKGDDDDDDDRDLLLRDPREHRVRADELILQLGVERRDCYLSCYVVVFSAAWLP